MPKRADDPKPAVIETAPIAPGVSSSGATPDPVCLTTLVATHGSDVRAAKVEAERDAACQVSDPVVVEAMTIGADSQKRRVSFQPPVTLSCAMATSISRWLETSVQPLAKGYFFRGLSALRVGGGHECRRRNRSANGPLSEHATGRALDVFAFVIGEDSPGERASKETKPGPDNIQGTDKAQGPDKTHAEDKTQQIVSVEKPDGAVEQNFLTAVRQSACGAFMTSLGPGSDAAHANHIHVDIQQRRTASSRFCQ